MTVSSQIHLAFVVLKQLLQQLKRFSAGIYKFKQKGHHFLNFTGDPKMKQQMKEQLQMIFYYYYIILLSIHKTTYL